MVLAAPSVWGSLAGHDYLWVDLVILVVVLGAIHVTVWVTGDFSTTDPGNQAGEGLRSACGAGLTVVGILFPVILLVVQLASAGSSRPVPHDAIVDLFV